MQGGPLQTTACCQGVHTCMGVCTGSLLLP